MEQAGGRTIESDGTFKGEALVTDAMKECRFTIARYSVVFQNKPEM